MRITVWNSYLSAKINQKDKKLFVVTDRGDWAKIKFHFFWKDHKNEMNFFLMLQHSQINFCSFLRKNELDWLGKCSLSFKILSLVWFWRKLKCVHHKHPSQYIISRFNFFFFALLVLSKLELIFSCYNFFTFVHLLHSLKHNWKSVFHCGEKKERKIYLNGNSH